MYIYIYIYYCHLLSYVPRLARRLIQLSGLLGGGHEREVGTGRVMIVIVIMIIIIIIMIIVITIIIIIVIVMVVIIIIMRTQLGGRRHPNRDQLAPVLP